MDDVTLPASAKPDDDQTWRDELHRSLDATYGRSDLLGGSVGCVSGYGIAVTVEKGDLAVSDGIGRHRRERRFARAGGDLRRLVVYGSAGSISLAALAWCDAKGVEVVVLADDTITFSSARATAGDARMLVAQVLARGNDVGLGIARMLVEARIGDQADIAAELLGRVDLAEAITAHLSLIPTALDFGALRIAEAQAASLYWRAWAGVPVRFVRQDAARVPVAWQSFGTRRSVITKANSRAATPANSILNYLSALAAIEARSACLALGMNTGVGFMHPPLPRRHSFAWDLIEPVRGDVERYVLRLLRERHLKKSDFTVSSAGEVRLLDPLRQELASTMATWGKAVHPWAEKCARAFAAAADGKVSAATRLTGADRRNAHGGKTRKSISARLPGLGCVACGAKLTGPGQTYCAGCTPAKRRPLSMACSYGHPLDDGNLYVTPKGERRCRTCGRARARQWRDARRATEGR